MVPLLSPVTVIGLALPVALTAPGLQVTRNWSIAAPPLPLAVKATLALALPAVATPMVGAAGIVNGVSGAEGVESAECSGTVLVAFTVQV